MRIRTRQKTKEITKTILELLAAGLAVTVVGALSRGRASAKLGNLFLRYGKSRMRETLKRLRLQGYVQYNALDEQSPIRLTAKGDLCCRRSALRSLFRQKKKRWDYLWRMVIFDIPERKKHLRELLRKELLRSGFYPLQRSIFVTPYTCEKEIEDLCAFWKMRKYVFIFITASLGRAEEKVRYHFFQQKYGTNK